MTDSPQACQTMTTAIPLIDVEMEAVKREVNQKLFHENFIYIPTVYYAQLTKVGLLNQLVDLIECESKINKQIKQILNRYNIHIPADYYARMTETNLFQPLLKTVHDVTREEEVSRIKTIKRTFNQRYESQDDDDDDDDNNNNNNERTNDPPTSKRQKTEHSAPPSDDDNDH